MTKSHLPVTVPPIASRHCSSALIDDSHEDSSPTNCGDAGRCSMVSIRGATLLIRLLLVRRPEGMGSQPQGEGRSMRIGTVCLTAVVAIGLTACTQREADSKAREAGRETREAGQDIKQGSKSAAREAGKAAHELAEETKEVASKVGKEMKKAGKEAKEGWDEAKRDDARKK